VCLLELANLLVIPTEERSDEWRDLFMKRPLHSALRAAVGVTGMVKACVL